jgi:Concanavalin A-like lectin/glucanases superfamily
VVEDWTHIACTADSTAARAYIDGAPVLTAPGNVLTTTPSNGSMVGGGGQWIEPTNPAVPVSCGGE